MNCPKCSFENRSGINFCEECGEPLLKETTSGTALEASEKQSDGSRTCPSCGFGNRADVKFCEECGELLIQKKLGPEPISEEKIADFTEFGTDKLFDPRIEPEQPLEAVIEADLDRKRNQKDQKSFPDKKKTTPFVPVAKVICSVCGAENQKWQTRCEKCGKVLDSTVKKKKWIRSLASAASGNGWRTTTIVLLIGIIISLGIIGVNNAKFRVNKNEALDMANAAVQMVDPQLNNVVPQVSETKDRFGNTVATYSYFKDVTMTTLDGQNIAVTIGAVATVNRNTGEIELITIR